MNKKYFILDNTKKKLSKETIEKIRIDEEITLSGSSKNYLNNSKERMLNENVPLKHVDGRIIIKVDVDAKDVHTFANGVQIYRGRRFNNLNVRETNPVNAFVVDAEYIPKGVEILVHPNSIHDSNRIFNYGSSSIELGNSVRYYSIEEASAFLFRDGEQWNPLKGFATGLRVFKPYEGSIIGIPPTKIENVLYITSGEFLGSVVHTLRACDYEIIFIGTDGTEQRIIRCRHYENEAHDREEIIIVRNDLTKLVKTGNLLIGLSENDCKSIS